MPGPEALSPELARPGVGGARAARGAVLTALAAWATSFQPRWRPRWLKLPTDGDRAAAQAVAARWVGFARDGRPDVRGLQAWPADAKFKSVLLEFGDEQVVRPDFMRHRLNTFIAASNLLGP